MKRELKQMLDKLNAADLEQVRRYVAMRSKLGMGKQGVKTDDMIRLSLEIICSVMRARGSGVLSYPAILEKSKQYAAFKRRFEVEGLGEWLREAAGRNRIKLYGLIAVAVGLLADELKSYGATVGATAIMNHFQRVPEVLDAAFPGYAQAGLLHLVIRGENEDVREEPSDESLSRREREPARKRNLLHNTGRGPRRGPPRRVR